MKYGRITLKRGMTNDMFNVEVAQRSGRRKCHQRAHQWVDHHARQDGTPIAEFNFENAWPLRSATRAGMRIRTISWLKKLRSSASGSGGQANQIPTLGRVG